MDYDMAKLLKWWHQYGFILTIIGYIFLAGMDFANHQSAMAALQETQTKMESQHDRENVDHRVTILEQIANDNRQNFSDIKDTERAIFQRINQFTDGKR